MVFEFKLPDIGEGVHEGEIAKWLVQPGDTLKEDQPMVEVMTDKVTVEITSPVAGVVQEQVFRQGETVKVGSVIIRINEAGAASGHATTSASQKTAEAELAVTPQAAVSNTPSVASFSNGHSTAHHPAEKVLAAPAVRKLARSMGVDLAAVSGTGPRGRVRKDDILALGSGNAITSTQTSPLPLAPGQLEKRIPFIGMRRKIGEHLVKSKHTAPHFTYVEEADMSEIVRLRESLLPDGEALGIKLTFLPFIIKAVIEGLKQYPTLNSTLDEQTQEIVLKQYYNIGVAVATPDGLVVPVIKNAQDKSIVALAQEIAELSSKARNNKLALADLQGGTFTLTSIGSIGGIFSAPIINFPEVGIMGIQKIEKRPVVRNDEIVIREMTYFSISCDHRVVDGAEAALFMKTMIAHLENPGKLFLNLR